MEDEIQTTGGILDPLPIVQFRAFIRMAFLAGEALPPFFDGVIKALIIVTAKNISFHLSRALDPDVWNGRAFLHDPSSFSSRW